MDTGLHVGDYETSVDLLTTTGQVICLFMQIFQQETQTNDYK